MKFGALALDYDRTIAVGDTIDATVRDAIGEVRRQGVLVILVTGRRLAELRRIADLACFDAVVAENGAVVHFPASGRHAVSAHPPSPSFLEALSRKGVAFALGEAIVETDASQAPVVLEALRRLEQPLVLCFNRGRLMVLPLAVAKSTGLRQVLTALRVSVHNTVGIGDAENDHDLLDACEVGVAVGWGSAALRAVADEVIAGEGPRAVAAFIRQLAVQPRLSAAQMGRRKLMLGREHNGEPLHLAVRGRTLLIAGEPGTGKSWLAGLVCEQLILQGYCLCILDPEGDHRSLESLPGVVVLGGEDPPPRARDLMRALRYPDISVVIDLSKRSHRDKCEYLRSLIPLLSALRRRTGLPHKILIDEAHYYLNTADSIDLIDQELAGYVLVTYRVSSLAPAVRNVANAVVLVTRERDPIEAATLVELCMPKPAPAASAATLADLAVNEAALLPGCDEAHGVIRRFRVAPRLTSHVRHRVKYLDMPVLEAQAFVFTDNRHAGPRARTLKEFMGLLSTLPPGPIQGHLTRHDFSRWVGGVFHDEPLAAHIRAMESRLGTDEVVDIAAGIAQAIRARYETAAVL